MPLPSGARLGVYELVDPIGAGGMGEVYRARDPRLGREVAIKVLPAAFASDPERLQRFEQEARAAAALNHPNILAVHDIGQHETGPFIVSELLEGETLRERLQHGALPVRRAIEYAVQIANGLAAAHEKGIVHRDLKPENVFVTADGRIKILDFGLAKLTQVEPALAGMSVLPTAAPDTLPGMVLGTVGYMAPEQVRGHTADHRSDIFALGTILYEMLAGRRAFTGETEIDAMTAILKEDPPDLPAVERHIPPALERIIDRCLEKNPAARFQSTRDLAFALESLSTHSDVHRVARDTADVVAVRRLWPRERVVWLSVTAVLIAVLSYLVVSRTDSAPIRATRFTVPPPDNAFFGSGGALPNMALSPDGRSLAFVAQAGGASGSFSTLWVRSFDAINARLIEGTEGATQPFWSPDGAFIGFFARGQIKRAPLAGGAPQTVYPGPVTGSFQSGTWSRQDVIVFAAGGRLLKVPATGGTPTPATVLDASLKDVSHRLPYFLPDGRRFLFLARPSNEIRMGSLDSSDVRRVASAESRVAYSAGHLLFVREGLLLAQPFDPDTAQTAGEAVPIAQDVGMNLDSGNAAFTASENGVVAYRTGSGLVSQLAWFDRSGRKLETVGEPAPHRQISLSPDGRQLSVELVQTGSGRPIWLMDLARGVSRRFTFGPGVQGDAIWSPDGQFIAFTMNGKLAPDLFQKSLSDGRETALLESDQPKYGEDWSRDGRFIAYVSQLPSTVLGVLSLPDRKSLMVDDAPFVKDEPHFSPDGRWLAYQSNESGQTEVYVQPFPGPGEKIRLSSTGGGEPRWRGDGRELFYLTPSGALMSVAAKTSGVLEFGAARELFQTRVAVELNIDQYAVTPDGQRFLVFEPVGTSAQTPVTVVLNWPAAKVK